MADVSGIKIGEYKGINLADVNGDGKVNKSDIKSIKKYVENKSYYDSMPNYSNEYNSDFKKAVDANGDGIVDEKDLSYYQQKNYSGLNIADINGDNKTDSADIKKIREYLNKKESYDSIHNYSNEYNSEFKQAADVNGDGKVDSEDIKIITSSDTKEALKVEIKKNNNLLAKIKATNHIGYDVDKGEIKPGGQMGANVAVHAITHQKDYLTSAEKRMLIKKYGSLSNAETAMQDEIDQKYLNLVDAEGNIAALTYQAILKKNIDIESLSNEKSLKLSKEINNTQLNLYKKQKEEYDKIKNDPNASDEEKAEVVKKIETIDKQINILENSNEELDKEIKVESYEKVQDTKDYKNYVHSNTVKRDLREWISPIGGHNVPYWSLLDNENPFDFLNIVSNQFNGDFYGLSNSNKSLYKKLQCYNYMTEDELKTYNYIFDHDGKDRAEEYFEILLNRVNQRKGLKDAIEFYNNLEKCETMDNEELKNQLVDFYVNILDKTKEEAEQEASEILKKAITSFGNVSQVIGECLGDGILNCLEGINNIGNMSTARTELEYKQMFIASMLESNGLLSGAGKFSSVVGNMVPAIMASAAISFAATPIAGEAAAGTLAQIMSGSIIFMSSFGNAQHDARCNGHDVLVSSLYGVLKGMSDATLKTTLGSVLGPNSSGIITYLTREGLADSAIVYVQGALRATVLGEKVDIEDLSAEACEAFIYGMLMASIFKSTDKAFKGLALIIGGKKYELTTEQIKAYLEEIMIEDAETGSHTKTTIKDYVEKLLKIKDKADGVIKKGAKAVDDEGDDDTEEYDPQTKENLIKLKQEN